MSRYTYVLNNPLTYTDVFNNFITTNAGAIFEVHAWHDYAGTADNPYMIDKGVSYTVTMVNSLSLQGVNVFDVNGEKEINAEAGGGVNGQVISVANGTAAFGPVGGMLDIGGVIDSYGNSKMYLTVGWAIGFGATAGMGYSRTNSNMTVNDLSGWASGVSFSVPYTPVGIEGYMDMSHGAVRDHYGNNLEGFGGNIGVGQGWFKYFSYTFIFSPPPPEFWTRPGSRR